MGALADQGDDTIPEVSSGAGRTFVEWWRKADDDDRSTVHRWVEAPVHHPGHKSYEEIAARLTASGARMSGSTILYGVQTLRRNNEWAP